MTSTPPSMAPLLRIYKQNQDFIIQMVVILLSVYLLAFAAQILWHLVPTPPASSVSALSTTNTQLQTSTKNTLDIGKISAAKLFGDASARPVVAVKQEVTEAPETKLNLTLTGVVSSTEPKAGAAIIENNRQQNTYGVGDKIDGTNAILDEIYRDRVIIKNRLVRETLMLDGIDYSQTPAATEQDEQQNNEQSDRHTPFAVSPMDPPNKVIGAQAQEMRQQVQSSPDSFTDFIAVERYAPDGEMLGYRVSPGKQAAFFKSVGLKPGDIVTQINGLDLSDLQQSLEAITVLNEAQSLQLDIIRGEEVISLDIDIPVTDE